MGALEEKEGTKKITFSQNVKKHCHLILNQYKSSLKWECRIKEKYITWFTKICWTHTFREHIYRQSKAPFECESVYLSVFLCAWASTKKQSDLHVVNHWFTEWAANYYILCGSQRHEFYSEHHNHCHVFLWHRDHISVTGCVMYLDIVMRSSKVSWILGFINTWLATNIQKTIKLGQIYVRLAQLSWP